MSPKVPFSMPKTWTQLVRGTFAVDVGEGAAGVEEVIDGAVADVPAGARVSEAGGVELGVDVQAASTSAQMTKHRAKAPTNPNSRVSPSDDVSARCVAPRLDGCRSGFAGRG